MMQPNHPAALSLAGIRQRVQGLLAETAILLEAIRQINAAIGSPHEHGDLTGSTDAGPVDWFRGQREPPRPSVTPLAHVPRSRGAELREWIRSLLTRGFDEEAYLYFNRDVREALATGRLASPRRHWLMNGRRESRPGGAPVTARQRGEPHGADGINLYGFLSSVSGLGTAARGMKRVVEASGTPTECFDLPNWEQAAASNSVQRGPYRTNLIFQNADVLPRFVRTYGEHILLNRHNIAHCVWELPALRSDWVENLCWVDEIWTPSEFNRAAYQAVTPLPVRVMPYAVDGLEELATLDRAALGLPEGPFLFTYVFDVASGFERKNPLALLDAFQKAFGYSEDVLLALKCHNGQYNLEGMRMLELRAAAPNIRLIHEQWTSNQIHSLHRLADCMVSPHRGEGFGLNMAETMYFGKAVVATNYGANTDFMSEENSYPVRFRLVEVQKPSGPYMPGDIWADPDMEHMSERMVEAFEDAAAGRKKGDHARATIRQRFSVESLQGRLPELLQAAGGPRIRHPMRTRPFVPRSTPAHARHAVRRMRSRPKISVITPVFNVEPEWLRRCVESVLAQWYPEWELVLCDDGSTNEATREMLMAFRGLDPRIKVILVPDNRGIASASNRAAEFATGEFLALLDNDDELTPDALLEAAHALMTQPEADLLYTDEDKLDANGNVCDPYFKPDWSPEHLQSVMYMLHLLVIRKSLFLELGGFREAYSGAQDYDLALRASAKARQILHVPKILYHWRMIPGSAAQRVDAKPAALQAGQAALSDFVRAQGLPATVEPGLAPGTFRVKYRVAGQPKVSLIILAGTKKLNSPGPFEVTLAVNLSESIRERTDYSNYEIVVAHDGDLVDSDLSALLKLGCQLLEFPGPGQPFNFSRKANWSVRQTNTEHVILMNDDLEVISTEWLSALLEYTQQPAIGAAGGQLLFEDGRIQHAGLVLGVMNSAVHVYYGAPGDRIGYNAFTHIVRNYSAVTAACMATKRSVFEQAGGFDEALSVDYNDVDYCLRLMELGYRIVYTPYSRMYHYEGQSLKRKKQNEAELRLFRSRWSSYLEADPFYNINLTRTRLDFTVDPKRR